MSKDKKTRERSRSASPTPTQQSKKAEKTRSRSPSIPSFKEQAVTRKANVVLVNKEESEPSETEWNAFLKTYITVHPSDLDQILTIVRKKRSQTASLGNPKGRILNKKQWVGCYSLIYGGVVAIGQVRQVWGTPRKRRYQVYWLVRYKMHEPGALDTMEANHIVPIYWNQELLKTNPKSIQTQLDLSDHLDTITKTEREDDDGDDDD